ncbi:MAG: ATP-binding protein [Alphaproteobacteria bacterium]|nr:ATP-binding protein [Alphaproteobacteria bacterium]
MSNAFENTVNQHSQEQYEIEAGRIFSGLIQPEQYVGDMFSLNYEHAKILVHDFYRMKVGGIPNMCFLIATRKQANDKIDFREEDSSMILLRVMDATSLPQDRDAERVRVETAQRVSGETGIHWDAKEAMDGKTRDVFGYAGVACRVIGTFFLEKNASNSQDRLSLKFGTDLSNFYSNRGFKVYKPNSDALKTIVNYADPASLQEHIEEYGSAKSVPFGTVRYASTNRSHQGTEDVTTFLYPTDLLAQKTALFGMTRTGKSNTTKVIAKSVYELRARSNDDSDTKPVRIGQVIFDPNGEYANENTQDSDGRENPRALKNIWEEMYKNSGSDNPNSFRENEVVIYGLHPHSVDPQDQKRRLMRLNFYSDGMLQVGKNIIDNALASETAQYFDNFRQVTFDEPQKEDFDTEGEFWEELKRFLRRTLAYRALLFKAGLKPPQNLRPRIKLTKDRYLFSKTLQNLMSTIELTDKRKETFIKQAAANLRKDGVGWEALTGAFEGLFYFLKTQAFADYNAEYASTSDSGQAFLDPDLERLLEMFSRSKGSNLIGRVEPQHAPDSEADYAAEIYEHLLKGKLVIVDQSSGDEVLNKASARRIMSAIFHGNQQSFRSGQRPKDILVYVEEAHNILPSGRDLDLSDVWVRTAKEGGKYKIGLVYATQEVSSIQRNILKNTANWFIAHLNNSDETKELCKFYDFADFEPSIRRAQDKGFLRVKTLSSPFVVPVQVDRFNVEAKTNV